ncbi:MAG: formate--tetrahydrofolate ligase [Gammaproteobacteria bacterium]|nr:formate--tetrahydrofolate ligase [Gammaproteobacteria bacterium]
MPASQHTQPLSDIQIARNAKIKSVVKIAEKLGIQKNQLHPYGHDKAKISLSFIKTLTEKAQGKLILVAGITPTRAGEGKTTTSVGLSDAFSRLGLKASVCLRQPSLGPCFGMKGGAAGGGYAQVVPMEDINLHFTGDFHAIGAANNLLAAMIDNHIYWGNEQKLDFRRISWRRVVDMNDRALREITNGLGAVTNGFPRTDGFDITAASEVMAIFSLATDLEDLQSRIGNMIIGQRRDKSLVYARDINAQGAMTVLLKDALQPNLVQTMEGTPAFIHGGPFANIAHGCNSVLATTTALKLTDYVVTEAGFGADLGAEKFFDIKMRKSGLKPDAAVIVCTVRALKMHGGCDEQQIKLENIGAMVKGFDNLARHVENTRKFGVPVVVAINKFSADSKSELDLLRQLCCEIGVNAIICDHWAMGGAGAIDLAKQLLDIMQKEPADFRYLYQDDMRLWDKVRTIAQEIYGAQGIIADQKIRDQFAAFQRDGYGHLPVCIAKTPLSFSTDPDLKGAPSNHVVPIRELRLSSGAGFLVVICGDVMTMPGLPRQPAAENITVNEQGQIEGLF